MKSIITWILILCSFIAKADNKAIEAFDQSQQVAWDLIFSNPKKALPKLIELKNQSYNYPDSMRAFAFNSLAVCYAVLGESFNAISMIDSALLISDTDDNRINLYLNKSMILIGIKNFKEAMSILDRTKIMAQASNNYQALQTAYEEMATIYGELGNYEMSLEMLLKSKELNSKLPGIDLRGIIINKQKMGNLYLKTRQYPFAEKLIREAALEFKENNFFDAYFSSLIGYIEALNKLDQFSRADSVLKVALPEVEDFGNTNLLAYYYTIYGNQLFGVGKISDARKYFEKAYAIYTDSNFAEFPLSIFVQYLDFLQKTGQNQYALSLLQKHLHHFQDLSFNFEDRLYYHTVFYRIYLALEMHNQAIDELIAKDNLRDSITINRNFSLDKFSNSKYFLDYYENLVQMKEDKITNLKIIFSSLSGIFVLVTVLLIFFYKKTKRTKNIVLSNLLEAKNEVIQWKNKYHELLLISQDHLKRESQKKKSSDEILDTKTAKDFLRSKEQIPEEQMAQIKELYQESFSEQRSKLKNLGLSKSEIIFCLFIYDGLKPKEISKVLRISPQSVATKKMRLSKKLELESSNELGSFLERVLK